MAKTITVKAAKEALNNLRKLKPANEKYDDELEMSAKEAVFFMAPDLVQLARRGFTSKELSSGLAADGIQIKPGTLNRYLNEYLVAKQSLEKPEAASKAGDFDGEKAEAAVKSELSNSTSSPDVLKGGGSQPPSPHQAAKNESPKPENQTGEQSNGKERPGYNNPKTPPENPKPGFQPGGVKSEWARAAESQAAPKSI